MISDRLIEPDSLVIEGRRAAVDVRIPWYRAIPASCIADVVLRIDGATASADSVLCKLNGTERSLEEFPTMTDESWFTTDALTVSGDFDLPDAGEHDVFVELKVYIPYIVTAHGVLMIDEASEARMAGASQ
ncbi:DUF6379 domain-containing protein [Marmoricola sp. URHB0036]|uniref:C-glycoside deglycosidase beta subunit domain-containing protein n=1 Tax=Marmoricola sp. URHB0036 TaxID=1298863 RepID=UPI0003F81FA6|nr:DUF6379 domain-containing protein [Marmoricola sp. URHB0036]